MPKPNIPNRETIFIFDGKGKSKLPKGTEGTLRGTATYVTAQREIKIRAYFRPLGTNRSATLISIEHIRRKA